MILKLPRKDLKMMSDVAKLFKDMTDQSASLDPKYYDFWRISMYSRVGLLKKLDVETIHIAMVSFNEVRKKHPNRDPKGEFTDLDGAIERLEAIMIKHNLELNPQPKVKKEALKAAEEVVQQD